MNGMFKTRLALTTLLILSAYIPSARADRRGHV